MKNSDSPLTSSWAFDMNSSSREENLTLTIAKIKRDSDSTEQSLFGNLRIAWERHLTFSLKFKN